MLRAIGRKLRCLRSVIRRLFRRRPRPKPDSQIDPKRSAQRPIRVATFNVAMFALAPAVAKTGTKPGRAAGQAPRGILKSPLALKSPGLKVSINLAEDEITWANRKGPGPARGAGPGPGRRSVVEVVREVEADVLALQDVKAEEEKAMRPLSQLANALGMKYYVFGESWAPEYGNAISSGENVLKATIDVPWSGEVNIYCTQLDHLDENWRMKQIEALVQSTQSPHILAGGLNSLNISDYSSKRWTHILKYYEEMRKPTPKTEVMKYLKAKGYNDSKDYAGEFEPVVIIAKGQNVQGTCKYGTRVDYVLSSSDSPYKFVPGSYSVISSEGTSDHHVVKVDVIKEIKPIARQNLIKRHKKSVHKLVNVTRTTCSSRGFWKINA